MNVQFEKQEYDGLWHYTVTDQAGWLASGRGKTMLDCLIQIQEICPEIDNIA